MIVASKFLLQVVAIKSTLNCLNSNLLLEDYKAAYV